MSDNLKNSPLVSVIIPCYNVSEYVEAAVNSILTQSYSNLEVWLVDDASTDDTLTKLRSFKDDRIKILAFETNTKKIGAVNDVLTKVNGDYIVFQDSDDWSEPTRIEEQVELFKQDDKIGICFTNYRIYSDKTNFSPLKINVTDEELRKEFCNFGVFKNNKKVYPTVCGTMMFSKKALKAVGGYNPYFIGRVAEDIEFSYRIIKQFKAIAINKVLYNYRKREGSFTQIQRIGANAKYLYSWHLLAKIIHKDQYENINVFAPEHNNLLPKLELEACEDALVESVRQSNDQQKLMETSTTYRIGKTILSPIFFFKRLIKRYG